SSSVRRFGLYPARGRKRPFVHGEHIGRIAGATGLRCMATPNQRLVSPDISPYMASVPTRKREGVDDGYHTTPSRCLPHHRALPPLGPEAPLIRAFHPHHP